MLSFRKSLKLFIASLLFLFGVSVAVAAAPHSRSEPQEKNYFIYIVQPGDLLILIALRYNLRLADIVLANNLPAPNLIFPGQQLILPGIPAPVMPEPVIPTPYPNPTHIVRPGETVAEIAHFYGVTVETVVLVNNLANPDLLEVGQTLQIPIAPPPPPAPVPFPFTSIELSEPTIIQGRTLVVKITLSQPVTLRGTFENHPLFFNGEQDRFWSLIAIHALTEPNIYPITFTASLADNVEITTIANVKVIEGPYGLENIQLDERRGELLDAELIQAEQEKLANFWSQVSPRPRWEGPFWYPVEPSSLRITSNFGTRRGYNNGPTTSFHGGTDFGGEMGMPIYASAAGTVVLAERLIVRGNAVLIDHGLGLFSGYWHQSQIAVTVGQEVQPGDLIGYLGDTGLVTGPHLHWEMRLNGIAVEPLQWVQQAIP